MKSRTCVWNCMSLFRCSSHRVVLPFILFLMFNTGCTWIVCGRNGERCDEIELQNNAFEAVVIVNHDGMILENKRLSLCMPDDLNPNKNGGVEPTFDQLTDYCNAALGPITVEILDRCQGPIESTSVVECLVSPITFVDAACEEECLGEVLDLDCSNLDRATAVFGGEERVCLAQQDQVEDGAQPVGAAMLERSTCDATGDLGSQVTIIRGNDVQTQPADAVVEFSGDLMPGSQIGMSSRLLDVGEFSFDALGGLTDATLKDVFASTSTVQSAIVDFRGVAVFEPMTTVTTGGGKLEKPLAPDETARYVIENGENLTVGLDLDYGICAVVSSAFGSDDGTDVEIRSELIGLFVNQFPVAYAGPDEAVECTSPAGASVTLDCSGSFDPDGPTAAGNIVAYQWRREARTGEDLGNSEPVVMTDQALNSTEEYFCNVMDSFLQLSSDSKVVQVVDTTPPSIDCQAPAFITPPEAPITFRATAADTCDASAGSTVTITGYSCSFLTRSGRTVDKSESCKVVVDGDSITILDVGGIGDQIAWTVTAIDDNGNFTTQECKTAVQAPPF